MPDAICVPGAEIAWTQANEAAYVAGVHEAGNPYFDYLFGDKDISRRVLLSWMRRASSEVSTGRSRLLMINGVLAGGYVLLSGEELKRSRSADLIALLTARGVVPRAVLQTKLNAAQGLFPAVEPADCYLSKIWTSPEFRGKGLAQTTLLPDLVERARGIGAKEIRLDVFAGNDRAREVYRTSGYREVGRQTAECGLEYVTMARAVGGSQANGLTGA